MSPYESLRLDVVIFGGGVTGLWLLDELHRAGYAVLLLEADALGRGQTIASQGIIHGGLKYSLRGLVTPAARAISAMPLLWRRCFAGERDPDLSASRLRAEYCHLWQTTGLRSRIGMLGARAGLAITPTTLDATERPAALRDAPGVVARLDEQVVEPESMLTALADRHQPRLLRIDAASGLEIEAEGAGDVRRLRLINPETGDPLDLVADRVVFAAGGGNDDLRAQAGLSRVRGQRRPLHMVVARGDLSPLNGHCVDGRRTRATITSTRDEHDRAIWQIGGQIAEDGVRMEPLALVRHARRELEAILPGTVFDGVEWSTYRVDRAEGTTPGGGRPTEEMVIAEGTTITAWPTKLVLAPRVAASVAALLGPPAGYDLAASGALDGTWPCPDVAQPPWEDPITWFDADSVQPG